MSLPEAFNPELESLQSRANKIANQIIQNYTSLVLNERDSFSVYLLYPRKPESPDEPMSPEHEVHEIVYKRVEAGLGIRPHPFEEDMAITAEGIGLHVHVTSTDYTPKEPIGVWYSTEPFEHLVN